MNSERSPQDNFPQKRFFADLSIGAKLGASFLVLVALIFFSAVVSYINGATATRQIEQTNRVRVPAALLASQAQADLLRMLGDVRGYLALGDAKYRDSYEQSSLDFERDLSKLKSAYAPSLGDASAEQLGVLQSAYQTWTPLPNQLFELRDDQLAREPAYKKLATDGVQYAGTVIVKMNELIAQQTQREASQENLELLGDMANFQSNFSAMLSALRGYVTTRNRIYRGEYEVNLTDNENSWQRLLDQRENLTPSQQELLDSVEKNRAAFTEMPSEIFTILESERWREDLYLFTDQAVPATDELNQSLNTLVEDQQKLLNADLSAGSAALRTANTLTIGTSVLAFIVALTMAYFSRRWIALPISRLTKVAEQIRGGDLEALASVESRDEIGLLAATFNSMTTKLRDTLFQVRKEKKRADDLLEVVIPIGVQLSTEKDFNRLLEKMLIEAKNFCRADTGILYMLNAADELEFVIIRSESLDLRQGGASGGKIVYAPLPMKADGQPNKANLVARAAWTQQTVNQLELGAQDDLWGADSNNQTWRDYAVQSLLIIPLKNSDGKTLGALQLLNAKDAEQGSVIGFDANLQQMMESFSSLAVAALEAFAREQKLKQEIKQLRIEIDEAKRKKQVSEIVDSDFFKDLSTRAKEMRARISERKDV